MYKRIIVILSIYNKRTLCHKQNKTPNQSLQITAVIFHLKFLPFSQEKFKKRNLPFLSRDYESQMTEFFIFFLEYIIFSSKKRDLE